MFKAARDHSMFILAVGQGQFYQVLKQKQRLGRLERSVNVPSPDAHQTRQRIFKCVDMQVLFFL